jgi:hypothetical protein
VEIGGACSGYETEEKNLTGIVAEPEKRPTRLSLGWEIILNLILKYRLKMCGLEWSG